MKRLLFTFSLFLIISAQAIPMMGEGEMPEKGRESHGGDRAALEFLSSAREGISIIKTSKLHSMPVSSEILEKLLDSVLIEVTNDELKIDRDDNIQSSTAINFYNDQGVPVIRINKTNWLRMSSDEKIALSIHELLCLLKVEKTYDYKYSSRFSLDILNRQLKSDGYVCDDKFSELNNKQQVNLINTFVGNNNIFTLRLFYDYRANRVKYIFDMDNTMIGRHTTSQSTTLCKKQGVPNYIMPIADTLFTLELDGDDIHVKMKFSEDHEMPLFKAAKK